MSTCVIEHYLLVFHNENIWLTEFFIVKKHFAKRKPFWKTVFIVVLCFRCVYGKALHYSNKLTFRVVPLIDV